MLAYRAPGFAFASPTRRATCVKLRYQVCPFRSPIRQRFEAQTVRIASIPVATSCSRICSVFGLGFFSRSTVSRHQARSSRLSGKPSRPRANSRQSSYAASELSRQGCYRVRMHPRKVLDCKKDNAAACVSAKPVPKSSRARGVYQFTRRIGQGGLLQRDSRFLRIYRNAR